MAGLGNVTRYAALALAVGALSFSGGAMAQQAEDATQSEMERRLELQRTLNESLEQRIQRLEAELNSDLCETLRQEGPQACLEPSSLIDFSRTTRPVTPGAEDAVVPGRPASEDEAALAPSESSSTAEEGQAPEQDSQGNSEEAPEQVASNTAPALSNLDAVNRLEAASVFIIAQGGSTGSGFMIGDGLVMTNQHVVAEVTIGARQQVLVTSESLGQPYPAVVVYSSPEAQPGSEDYAILAVEGLSGNPTVSFASSVRKLDTVFAAGYPGLVVLNDNALTDLFEGDAQAAPDLVLSSGEVSAIQETGAGQETVAHTASIMSGNSGGPLMDVCGRIVGINTYITADQESASRAGFALSSKGILAFLARTGTSVSVDGRECAQR